MFLTKIKCCSCELKKRYSIKVHHYLEYNSILLLKNIYDEIIFFEKLDEETMRNLLGNYPKAPWIDEMDSKRQFICLLKEAGYVFLYDKKGNIKFKNKKIYNRIVQNHLKLSGKDILERLADMCEMTSGRISYKQMQEVLGAHYPKAPYAKCFDERISIILFLRELKLPFKFDDFHIYLP